MICPTWELGSASGFLGIGSVNLALIVSSTGRIRCAKNLRAVQLLLCHFKLESTVRYLGIEVEDALKSPNKRKSEVVVGGGRCSCTGLSPFNGIYAKSVRGRVVG